MNTDKKIGDICDFCEQNKTRINICNNCEYVLCDECLLGDDIIPEGLIDNFDCCDNSGFKLVNGSENYIQITII